MRVGAEHDPRWLTVWLRVFPEGCGGGMEGHKACWVSAIL